MREYFNKHLLPKVQNGDFTEQVVEDRHANPVISGQVFCTYSQLVALRDKVSNDEVALIHRYKLPTGEIGASRLPDPVRIEWDGEIRKLKPKSG